MNPQIPWLPRIVGEVVSWLVCRATPALRQKWWDTSCSLLTPRAYVLCWGEAGGCWRWEGESWFFGLQFEEWKGLMTSRKIRVYLTLVTQGTEGKEEREGGSQEPGNGGEARKTKGCGDIVSRKHCFLKKNSVVDYNVSSDLFIIKSSRFTKLR